MNHELAEAIRDALPQLRGMCYKASEAYYHLSDENLKPVQVWLQRDNGVMDSHWWLENKDTGEIVDLTADQYEVTIPYDRGRGRGFLTGEPSKAAQEIINNMQWEGA